MKELKAEDTSLASGAGIIGDSGGQPPVLPPPPPLVPPGIPIILFPTGLDPALTHSI